MKKIRPVSDDRPFFWSARDFQEVLEYKSWKSFVHLIEQAVKTMVTAGIPYYKNVIRIEKEIGGKYKTDFKLSRFACFLVVMLADYKKEAVTIAQARFMQKAEKIGWKRKHIAQLERFKIREEIADANKWLNSMVSRRALKNFGPFSDAGFQGLYGMNSDEVHALKGLDRNKSVQDIMGTMELVLHLMRIVLTEESIYRNRISKQVPLEDVHFKVSKDLRALIKKYIGLKPEQLPVLTELPKLRKELKLNYKKMNSK